MKKIVSVLAAAAIVMSLIALPQVTEAKTGAAKYSVTVDTSNQQVRVFENMDNGSKKLVKKFICSTGKPSTPTPAGTFKMTSVRQRFGYFVKFGVWAQYKMQFNGDILFHSVLYKEQNVKTLIQSSVDNLGKAVSHGCVRLRVADAAWIWENCPSGTVVKVAKFSKADAQQQVGVVVDSVKLSYSKVTLKTNTAFTLKAETSPSGASNSVTWSSSNRTVAKVDANGKVTAVKPGSAAITATSKQHSAKKASCSVTVVKNDVEVSKITIAKTEYSLYPGDIVEISAKVFPEYAIDAKLKYSSADTKIAKVSAAGVITAGKTIGNTVITVSANKVSKKIKVTVKPIKVVGLELSVSKMSIKVGDVQGIKANFIPSDATPVPVTWVSSDPTIASVSAAGNVKGRKKGKAVITATCEGITAACNVTVSD